MKLCTLVRAGVLGSALATLLTQGYTFDETSDLSTDSTGEEESTGLTTNEEDRIFGGSEADASQFPFIVSLRANENTYCGGTLIASQYVVTAAHCVKTDKATIYASIGSAFDSGSGDGEQLKVIEGYKHPMYNKSEHLYDVGVLKLEKEVSVTTLGLCAADGSDNEVGTVATVRGWGLTENGSQSLMLKEVNVQIITNADCNKQYSDQITEGMLCAGEGDGKDSCNGDSGGPLIANDVLVGIVSWGGKCGVNAGVYTRVSFVLDYINDIIGGGTGSRFTESTAGSSDQGQGKSPALTEVTNVPAAEQPATKTPNTQPPTAAPASAAPTPAPTTEAPETESPSTNQTDQSESSTEEPETESSNASQDELDTEGSDTSDAGLAAQYEPDTDAPTTDSSSLEDQFEPATKSAEQNKSTVNSAEQIDPVETEAPTPASDKHTQSGKECATQF